MKLGMLLGLLATLVGCQWSHTFHLEDLDQLQPGRSTKAEVERLLGASEYVARPVYYSSEQGGLIPPVPLSWVLFPIFMHAHSTGYEFSVQYDASGVLVSGSLLITEVSRTRVLLCIGGDDIRVHLEDLDLALLRRLEEKGIEVRIGTLAMRCFGGILGWESVPLEEYLSRSPED